MGIIWLIVGIVVIVAIVAVAFLAWGIKKAVKLLINSVIGFFALWLVQQLLLPTLVINIWSVLLTAIFGIFGFALVLILHLIGLAF